MNWSALTQKEKKMKAENQWESIDVEVHRYLEALYGHLNDGFEASEEDYSSRGRELDIWRDELDKVFGRHDIRCEMREQMDRIHD